MRKITFDITKAAPSFAEIQAARVEYCQADYVIFVASRVLAFLLTFSLVISCAAWREDFGFSGRVVVSSLVGLLGGLLGGIVLSAVVRSRIKDCVTLICLDYVERHNLLSFRDKYLRPVNASDYPTILKACNEYVAARQYVASVNAQGRFLVGGERWIIFQYAEAEKMRSACKALAMV